MGANNAKPIRESDAYPREIDIPALLAGCSSRFSYAGWAQYRGCDVFDGARRRSTVGEIVYLERGRLRWQTEMQQWTIEAPALALARPGESERREFLEDTRHAFIHFRANEDARDAFEDLGPIPPQVLHAPSPEALVMEQLLSSVAARPQGWETLCHAILRYLITRAILPPVWPPSSFDTLPDYVRRALLWLPDHWMRHGIGLCSLADLASAAGCSPKHCNRIFQQHLGVTPIKAVQIIRGGLALELLQRERSPVKAIAYRLGFRHPNHLTQLLTAEFGMSPEGARRARQTGLHVPTVRQSALREVMSLCEPIAGDRRQVLST